jgi:hypothetical protein
VAGTRVARMTARANTLLLRLPSVRAATAKAVLTLVALLRAITLAAVLSAAVLAAVAAAGEPSSSLIVGAVGVLLSAFALARCAAVVLRTAAGRGPVVSARDHHRALARRAVPRLRDPDAPGRTRSRAPSALLPAAP